MSILDYYNTPSPIIPQPINLMLYQQHYSYKPQCLNINDSNIYNKLPLQKNNGANYKVKTSLCKKWSESGYCPYGYKCQFAHGLQELRCNVDDSSYKTRPCNAFFKKGYCPYGFRCNFSHKEESQQIEEKQSRRILPGYYQILKGANRSQESYIKNMSMIEVIPEDGDQKSTSSTEDCNSEYSYKSILFVKQQNCMSPQFESYGLLRPSQVLNQFHSQQKTKIESQIKKNETDQKLLIFNIDQF